MNLPQRVVLTIGVVAIAAMVLFPPWLFVYDPPSEYQDFLSKATRPAGYHLVFTQSRPQDQTLLSQFFEVPNLEDWASPRYFSMIIDKDRLGVQLAGMLVIVAFLVVLLKNKNP